MPTGFLSPIGTPTQQFFTDQGVVLAGGLINTYLAGTTTPAPTFTTSGLSIANPNPIVLNSAGRCPQEVWLQPSTAYKFVITDSAGNPVTPGTYDNISGINSSGGGGGGGGTQSEWVVSSLTPTFVDGTHFTVPGNQTTVFTPGRRMYATVTAGTIYGTIVSSTFGSSTSVTVLWDSGVLDSGLSQVAIGILNPSPPSYQTALTPQIITSVGPLAPTPGAIAAKIRMVGGGAAGGGVTSTNSTGGAAGGGASGSFMEFWITSGWQSLAGTTLTPGAAGVGVAGNNGGVGGNTTFGAFATAPGGPAGQVGATTSNTVSAGQIFSTAVRSALATLPTISAPGIAIILKSGEDGKDGFFIANAPAALQFLGGDGGSNPLGTGGRGQINGTAATAGTGYGAGGGGAISNGVNTSVAGANGAPGAIIIEEFL